MRVTPRLHLAIALFLLVWTAGCGMTTTPSPAAVLPSATAQPGTPATSATRTPMPAQATATATPLPPTTAPLPTATPVPATSTPLATSTPAEATLTPAPATAGPTSTTEATWPAIALEPVVSELNLPVHATNAGDGSGRLFVIEQGGRIMIVRDGQVQAEPFLDISDKVLAGGERGLLSVAFPPGYANKGHFYVNYTRRPYGDTIVARYRLLAGSADRADPASEEIVLHIQQPFANHNGGQLAFSPRDGYLYVGMGDGGSGGDPMDNAQNLGSLLGKLLRIDVETASSEPYVVPSDNPFVGQEGARPEIWALGLRNPWRFSFDRETGDTYIADVGQGAWEEVDFQPADSTGGENYGWPTLEGTDCYRPSDCAGLTAGLTAPVAEYGHDAGISITGGFVYRGSQSPALHGIYLYADYGSGRIWGLRRQGEVWQSMELLQSGYSISSFGEDEFGEVYVVDRQGALYRLVAVGNTARADQAPG